MSRVILCFLAFSCCIIQSVAQVKNIAKANPNTSSGYNIPITLTPLKNTWIYLGCHYGKYKNLADSAWLNEKSQGAFKGNTTLPGGIYFIVSPQKVLLFEVLMDNEQKFSIQSDTSKPDLVTITGSPENAVFQQYTQYLAQKAPDLSRLQRQLSSATNAKDSTLLKAELDKKNKELQAYKEGLIKKYPNSLLTIFFNTLKRPEIPAMPKLANGKVDSTYPYFYVKNHWWDDVSFDDDRLVRTPFFEPKLEEYFKYYVDQQADSVIKEVNFMLLVARNSKEMFKYLMGKFTDKYINPEFMGQEKVFLFLFDKYYSKGDTSWLSLKQKQYIFDRAYSLMANQIGEAAPELQMLDTTGKPVSLYSITAPFTFVSFWDPHCGHCKEMVPRVDSMYKAKWKNLGVKLVGVNVDAAAVNDWKKFINENKLNNWVHIYQTKAMKDEEAKKGLPNFRQLYDVFKTPTFYLLDDKKRIIGKMLSIEQFDDILKAKLKNKS
jgi:thiol-disulfide isomerase/thioredoxin